MAKRQSKINRERARTANTGWRNQDGSEPDLMGLLVELLTKHEMTCWASRDGEVFVLREKIGGGKPYPHYLHRAPTLAGAVQLAWDAMQAKVRGASRR